MQILCESTDIRIKTFIYGDLSYKINGILFKVHNNLGRFLNEKHYCDVIEQELIRENIPHKREYNIPGILDGEKSWRNRVDFLIDDKIVLEIKTKRMIERDDYYQVRRYLAVLRCKLAMIVNFRDKLLKPKRILNSATSE